MITITTDPQLSKTKEKILTNMIQHILDESRSESYNWFYENKIQYTENKGTDEAINIIPLFIVSYKEDK